MGKGKDAQLEPVVAIATDVLDKTVMNYRTQKRIISKLKQDFPGQVAS